MGVTAKKKIALKKGKTTISTNLFMSEMMSSLIINLANLLAE